jgi:hypothetical protein
MPRMIRLGLILMTAELACCSSGGSHETASATGGQAGTGMAGSGGGTAGSGGSSAGAGGINGACGGQTCGPTQYCCGPSECGFCAAQGTGPFCGFTCEDAGTGGSSGGGGGTGNSDPACTMPAGSDVAARDYSVPSASGCSPNFPYGSASITLADEDSFLATFNCPAGASSGIDFSSERLRVTIFSSTLVQPRKWAVETGDAVHVGFDSPPACGGALPPNVAHMTLLPAGVKPVLDDLCSGSCDFGGGGFPP